MGGLPCTDAHTVTIALVLRNAKQIARFASGFTKPTCHGRKAEFSRSQFHACPEKSDIVQRKLREPHDPIAQVQLDPFVIWAHPYLPERLCKGSALLIDRYRKRQRPPIKPQIDISEEAIPIWQSAIGYTIHIVVAQVATKCTAYCNWFLPLNNGLTLKRSAESCAYATENESPFHSQCFRTVRQ